ncbi:MAG: hypothetical protein MJ202_10250 [Lentisphaeria bacterium]|nr:hypothetical protein [Lentisphaeria bacterium]
MLVFRKNLILRFFPPQGLKQFLTVIRQEKRRDEFQEFCQHRAGGDEGVLFLFSIRRDMMKEVNSWVMLVFSSLARRWAAWPTSAGGRKVSLVLSMEGFFFTDA